MGQDTPLSFISQAMHPDTSSDVGWNFYDELDTTASVICTTLSVEDFELSPQLLPPCFRISRTDEYDWIAYIFRTSKYASVRKSLPRPRPRVSQTAQEWLPAGREKDLELPVTAGSAVTSAQPPGPSLLP
ncbi:hypothetical protein PHLGIDRAFT_465417 [Phlebiopsis gigantea 11061_1 CR5-6]|uniref:Uncharacterized protein n=1 Tax=Phlebiopsis gigantea (strain 11061_1 CR5-6) TaxID=745531 RepID=A0A0C3PJH9_PHLG1|nr:hypothetical protein PHLGIDRAFT_465417 [Phlebiopsis gigantea 11061_1 CR5-6]